MVPLALRSCELFGSSYELKVFLRLDLIFGIFCSQVVALVSYIPLSGLVNALFVAGGVALV